MKKLEIEQLLYLFYTFAYEEEGVGSVTQGTVRNKLFSKGNLSKKRKEEEKKQIDVTREFLCKQKYLKLALPSRVQTSRVSITEAGKQALVENLQATKKPLHLSASHKVNSALMECLRFAGAHVGSVDSIEEIDFETFVKEFKELYFKERRRQAMKGVVAIRSHEICDLFSKENSISQERLQEYFEQLKSSGKVFATIENDQELIEWAE